MKMKGGNVSQIQLPEFPTKISFRRIQRFDAFLFVFRRTDHAYVNSRVTIIRAEVHTRDAAKRKAWIHHFMEKDRGNLFLKELGKPLLSSPAHEESPYSN